MKKMLFIFNPRSGRERLRTKLLDILDLFVKAGYEVTVHVTQSAGDAQKQVEKKGGGVELLVCSGGDGTLRGGFRNDGVEQGKASSARVYSSRLYQ